MSRGIDDDEELLERCLSSLKRFIGVNAESGCGFRYTAMYSVDEKRNIVTL
ncbi:unnamed protein product, partial [Taenia asiatica]|uniref:Transcriptional regulator n=1 Tax=Taenia asiatica TaxID=60517 RepID=A0A0R3VW59_TAEAS